MLKGRCSLRHAGAESLRQPPPRPKALALGGSLRVSQRNRHEACLHVRQNSRDAMDGCRAWARCCCGGHRETSTP